MTPKGASLKVPTQVARLTRGSVVVFGSAKTQQFVIDTVFVVGDEMIEHSSANYERKLDGRITLPYREVTIDSWYSGTPPPPASQIHRLYFGATPAQAVDEMFSFFPCAPLDEHAGGFVRPRIDLDQVTQNKAMGFRRTFLAATRDAGELWQSVVEQVLQAGLRLGVRADLPPRSTATVATIPTTRMTC